MVPALLRVAAVRPVTPTDPIDALARFAALAVPPA